MLNLTIESARRMFAEIETGTLEAVRQGRVVIFTQVWENYGTHTCDCASDSECTCNNHWKAKGGSEYAVAEITSDMPTEVVHAIVSEGTRLVDQACVTDRFYNEYVIGYEIYWDGALTDMETPMDRFDPGYPANTSVRVSMETIREAVARHLTEKAALWARYLVA